MKAFIHGECIRIVKRNSSELIFLQHRELFRHRLLARGYQHKFIGSLFSKVSYADRHKYLFERHEAAKFKSSISLQTENQTPALIALSLQHSQRADALGIAQTIFFCKIGVPSGKVWCAGGAPNSHLHPCKEIGGQTWRCADRISLPPTVRGTNLGAGATLYLIGTREYVYNF